MKHHVFTPLLGKPCPREIVLLHFVIAITTGCVYGGIKIARVTFERAVMLNFHRLIRHVLKSASIAA